jgi:hypothetical protein
MKILNFLIIVPISIESKYIYFFKNWSNFFLILMKTKIERFSKFGENCPTLAYTHNQ